MSSTTKDTKRADSLAYLRHWKKTPASNSSVDDGRKQRIKDYNQLANDFYDNSTDFYLEGWGQSFHFCRYPRGREPMPQAMARHEHYLAHKLGLEEGMTVLDAGCGIGGPAKEIATFARCKVVGLNNNQYQIDVGQRIAKEEGVDEHVMQLVQGDFMKIPFPDETFDAVYAIEATVHASSLAGVYKEIARVLKPGGRFGIYEWVMLDNFDPENPRHILLRSGMERGNGIANIQTAKEAREAMIQAGLTLDMAENIAGTHDAQPWWYFVDGSTQYAYTWRDWGRVIRMTGPGRVALDMVIRGLEILGVARKGTAVMAKEMIHGGDCIAEAARNELFTSMYLMVGTKEQVKESI